MRGTADLIGPGLFTTVFAVAIENRTPYEVPGVPYFLAASILGTAVGLAWIVARPAAQAAAVPVTPLPPDPEEYAPASELIG